MSALHQFGAYRKSLELFDLVVGDMERLRPDPRAWRLVSQQVASADSICANIEEGYGRLSRAEYVRFLDIARGSARETQGRYGRLKHWLPAEIIADRARRLDEIIGILTATIETLRRDLARRQSGPSVVKEDDAAYGGEADVAPSTPDTRHSPPIPPLP
jgi:four helix bundle protein